jgi:hypothetical protein
MERDRDAGIVEKGNVGVIRLFEINIITEVGTADGAKIEHGTSFPAAIVGQYGWIVKATCDACLARIDPQG